MSRSAGRAVVAMIVAALLFGAGAQAPAFVLAGDAKASGSPWVGWFGPQIRNSVPLAIRQPVAPIEIVGVPGGLTPGIGSVGRPDMAPYVPPSQPEEVAPLRSEFGIVIANPDGTFTAQYNAGRINFRDQAGVWNPIDLTLVPDDNATYGLHTAANSFDLRVNARGDGGELAELQLGDQILRLRQLTPVAGAPTVGDGAANFPAPAGQGAVSIWPTPEGLEFTVSLADSSRAGTYNFILDTGGLRAESGLNGVGVRLLDANGVVVATVSPPSVVDGHDVRAPMTVIGTTIADSASVIESTPVGAPEGTSAPSTTPEAASPSPTGSAPDMTPPVQPAAEVQPQGTTVPSASPESTPVSPAGTFVASPEPAATAAPTASPTAVPSPVASLPPGVVLGPNQVLLSYTIDPAWIQQAGRAFPVTLDPTICIQKGQTTPPNGCDYLSAPAGYTDQFVDSANPNSAPYGWDEARIGWDTTSYNFQKQRAFFYFPDVVDSLWDDGFELTNASLILRQATNSGSGQKIQFQLVTGAGWSNTSTWNSQPSTDSSVATGWLDVATAAQVPVDKAFDITTIARHWYTHDLADWRPNLGVMAWLEHEANQTNGYQVTFRNKLATVDNRPQLALTYVAPKAEIDFDAGLGSSFAPTTMPVGTTVGLPITVSNKGSGFSFVNSGTDYYALGYRWLDSAGTVVGTSASLTSLLSSVANNGTSSTITMAVTPPSTVGQYTLRLDLVHVVGSDWLWASDWALPSLYQSGVRQNPDDPGNTRVLGSSVVRAADYSVAVVAGGGTADGDIRSVALADGSSLGINLWSRNLRFDGSGGSGFADLGGDFGLSYFYDSADRSDCSAILRACGWGTNFDEGFRPGATGSDYVYVDAAGNRYLVNATASGQLVSSAGARIERLRHTLLDENWMTGTSWASAWDGTDPVISTTYSYNSSGHSYKIGGANSGTATSSFVPVDLDHYPLLSFAIKGATATKGAIGFYVNNQTHPEKSGWLVYTVGGDISISGVSKINLSGTISSWNQAADQRDMRADAVTKAIGAATDSFSVSAMELWGSSGQSGNLYYDAVRFQGGADVTMFDNSNPTWSANAGKANSPNTSDKLVGSASLSIQPASETASPDCDGSCFAEQSLLTHPFVSWSWKKVGGTTVAMSFHVKDMRLGSNGASGYKVGTITYYAGPKVSTANWIQVADTAPSGWTTITRNVLDDARESLEMFDNYAATVTPDDLTPGGPRPDPLDLTGYRLIALDGNYALFDVAELHALTNLGDDYASVSGDEFVVTLPGHESHYFDRAGSLERMVDADANVTVLDWTYDLSAEKATLTSVHAPSDGLSITGGTATRRLDVTYTGSTLVKFAEVLNGVTGRYAEFTRDGSNNLTSVVPARRSAACAGSGASGCLKFAYETGTSLLNRVTDPRDTGSNSYHASIAWTSSYPTAIRSGSTNTDLLRINDWGNPTSSLWRVRVQDANGIAASGNGYTRPVDLTPNGSVLTEWRPIACTVASCGSNGASGTLVDKLSEYGTDGINNYTTETHYRLNGNQGAVITRRGSFASATVDNLVDPLAAQRTPWTQSAAQYAASTDTDHNMYRTTYVYDADGNAIRVTTPFTNPTSSSAVNQTLINRFDSETHLLESSDNTFLTNGGFESGLDGWSTGGSTTAFEQGATNVKSGFGSLKVTGTGNAYQSSQLVPGQTFRFQVGLKVGSGSGATYQVDYQRASDSSWQALLAPTTDSSASWKSNAFDLTIPADGTGLVKVTLKIGSGSGTVYFDDVVIMTTYAAASYLANGLADTRIDVLNRTTKFGYAASTAHPAIFVTAITANYVSGGASTADQNVVSSQTYNAWGLPLVSTDPDGVTSATTYASNKTDVASVANGLGNTTQFTSYDTIGQLLTTQDPLSRTTTTAYDWFGNPVDQTDFGGVVTHSVYDGVGRNTSVYANYVSGGSGTSGVNNILTTFAYDENGQVTRQVGDSGSGLSNATTDTTYDLVGNFVTSTAYPTGTSNGRTVTTYYGAAGLAVGSSGPIVPTAGSAPTCPGTSSKCNAISSLDMNGRSTLVTDAYGVQTLVWYDLSGKPVRQVANYVSGGASNSVQNVASSTRYDAADRVVSVTDPLGNVTSTTYDNLDRVIKITRADNSWVSTTFKASGRIDTEARPTATTGAEVWTKRIYDAAGRQTKTIDHYDTTTQARLWLTPFEAGSDGWVSTASGYFTATATSATSATTDGYSGAKGLTVASGSASNAGSYLNLSGSSFKSGHGYRVRARVKAASGVTLQGFFGVDASGGDYASSSTLAADGTWQVIDFTWTPTADRASNVHLALRRSGTSAVSFYVDDAIVWDTYTGSGNTPDWNIPTETVHDAAGRITGTIMAPGDPTTDGAFVTLTGYTTNDQVASVRAAATPDYPATSGEVDLDLLTSYTYDALRDKTDVTDPAGVITHYDYDRRGDIVGSTANYVSGQSATASQNVKATFAYDNLGELLASCAPKHVQAGCDPTTPSSTAWRYTYDELGHVLTATPPGNTTGTALSATTNTYDTASGGARLTRSCDNPAAGSCSNANRYVDFEYDALDRITKVTNFTGYPTSSTEALRTESAYDAGSERTSVTYFEAGTQKDALAFSFDSLGRNTVVSRGGTAITTYVFDPMSNATSRTDQAISSTASTFTYDWRGNELTATSPTYSGTSSLGWRLDGLVASRTWPTATNAATFAYDRAKRPTTLTEKYSGANQAVFSQAYDRTGSVTSEGRTLSGVSGVAGSGTQSFTYDSLRRVTGSSISGGPTMSFGYDANSNRTSWNDGVATTTYDYNESDELTAQHRSGTDRTYAYDANGNMTSSAVAGSGATAYTYDALDHLLSLTPPSGGALTYTLDALGRHWTKSVGGTLAETYGYIGASESVDRIDLSSGSVNAAVDAIGNRMATSTSAGGFGWLLPDLHGNVAGAIGSNGSAVSDAFRYSAYGTSIGASTSSLPSPWRFQGRLALNSDDGSGNNTDLYDFVARSYDPNLAAFTSLDSVAGGAQNPLTLNRFLYALASPATLIDPNGHYVDWGNDANGNQSAIAQRKNAGAIAAYKKNQAVIAANRRFIATRQARGLDQDEGLLALGTRRAAEARAEATQTSNLSAFVTGERSDQYWEDHAKATLALMLSGAPIPGDPLNRTYTLGVSDPLAALPPDIRHVALGGCSALPIAGVPCAAADAAYYASEGDWVSVGLSVAAMFPGAGLLKLGKFARIAEAGAGPVLRGQAGVRSVIADLEAAGGQYLGKEITLEVNGVRTRPDLWVKLPNGQKVFLEVKTGPYAGWTPNQAQAFPQIWSGGAIPWGDNAAEAGLEVGARMGPTPIWTVWLP
ncbi:MAG: carbohydrate binding domain-containing protein [Chloroflexota bacterium]